MILLDGKKCAQEVKASLKEQVNKLLIAEGIVPHLAIILVGEVEASQIYVRNKLKAAKLVGIKTTLHHLANDTTQEQLLDLIKTLNEDQLVNGIIVQLPLPKHLNEQDIINYINPDKDVDGFGVLNKGRLFTGLDHLPPATPQGIIYLLDYYHIDYHGKHSVVVGRSNIVGKPMAIMLLDKNTTVTIAHSKTKDLASICREADILVSAVGRLGIITSEMVKPGAVVVDVGMNRNEKGLAGDVDFDEVSQIASFITPVPGGVGPMTIAMLLVNTYQATLNQYQLKAYLKDKQSW